MIAVVDVQIQAANPSMPLYPWRAFAGSPSSLRIRNVPKRIGNWNINRVYVNATYPDGSVKAADCVLTGGVYVCTVEGSGATGTARNGYTVYADGVDENDSPVTGYILGKGDISILEADGQLDPGKTLAYVHLLSAESSEPKDGDVWQVNGSWYIYQDGQAWPIGDDSGLIGEISAQVGQLSSAVSNKADKTQLQAYELTANMQTDVSSIVTARTLTDWSFPEKIGSSLYGIDEDWIRQNGDPNETYYFMEVIWNATGDDRWVVSLQRYSWDSSSDWLMFDYQEALVSAPEDTLTLNCSFYIDPQYIPVVLSRENQNALGIAMMSDLSAKADVSSLSNYATQAQLSTKADYSKQVTVLSSILVAQKIGGGNWTMYDDPLRSEPIDDLTLNQALMASDSQHRIWWSAETTYEIDDAGTVVTYHGWAVAVYNPSADDLLGFTFNRRDTSLPTDATDVEMEIGSGDYDGQEEFQLDTTTYSSWADAFAAAAENPVFIEWGGFSSYLNGTTHQSIPVQATVNVVYQNELSAATLPQDESNALANYTEDEYKTKVTFNTNTANVFRTQIFDWQGEVNSSMLSDLELSAIEGIKFGKGVSAIADGAFQNIGTGFHEVYFSDSLRRIGISAFAGNGWLYKVVYGDDTPRIKFDGNYAYNINEGGELSIGDSAFQGCTQLGQAILPDIDKLTVGENAFAGCNFRYSDIINGQMIHTAGIFFRNFYSQNSLNLRLDAHNLSAERAAGICHPYIPATVYDIEKAGQDNDSKYLGTYADAKFSVTARGANLTLSASVVNNVHISADPGSNRTKSINLPTNLNTDHSPRSLTVDLSVDAGVTFAGTVNKTIGMDWYLDGTMEQYGNEFLSAGVDVLWKFWEYKPNKWCAKKLGVR